MTRDFWPSDLNWWYFSISIFSLSRSTHFEFNKARFINLEIDYLEILYSRIESHKIPRNRSYRTRGLTNSNWINRDLSISYLKSRDHTISIYFFNLEIKKSRSLKSEIDTTECFLFWDFMISIFTISRSNLVIHLEILSHFLEIFLEINKYTKYVK